MTLIRKIIDWFKRLFQKLFKRKNKEKKIKKKKIISKKKGKHVAAIAYMLDEAMPGYMLLSNQEKEKLIYSISLMKNVLKDNRDTKKEKDISEIIKVLKNNSKINKELFSDIENDNDKILNSKYLDLLIKELDVDEKQNIINKQQVINKEEKDFKIHLDRVDKVIELIKNNDITIVSENEIENEVSTITNDKNINQDTIDKIDGFYKNIHQIIDNADKDFLSKVIKEYNKINYVTVSTTIIDQSYEKFKKLEEDFKNHRYNKYYYEREIKKIKHELNQIKNIKSRKDVSEHINKLKNELYTKSKDKYDLLYNNEVFMNFEKECDNLLDKINTKVVDIKKEKKEEKKDDIEKKKDEYLENIILRFKDMKLARELILMMEKEHKITNKNEMINFINQIYNNYNEGLNCKFNFEKNKDKTELVILYNGLNEAINKLNNEPYITIDHINFRMEDLIEASRVKKDELNTLLQKNNIKECDDQIVDDKMDIIEVEKMGKKKDKHILQKK